MVSVVIVAVLAGRIWIEVSTAVRALQQIAESLQHIDGALDEAFVDRTHLVLWTCPPPTNPASAPDTSESTGDQSCPAE